MSRLYKRPVPRNGSPIPSSDPHKSVSQASGLGWRKWTLPIVEEAVIATGGPEGAQAEELSPIDLEALEAEQQALELEALREAARAEGHTQGVESGQREGHEAGFAAGHEEGMAKAQQEAQKALTEKLAVLDALIAQSRDEFSRLQEDVGESLVHLGVRVAEHVLGHAIKRPATSTLAIVKEVLRQNDEDGQVLTIWLHPQDLSLIEDEIKAIPALCKVRLLPDGDVGRGGVKVRTPHGDVDATLQARWNAAVASMGYEPRKNLDG